MKIIKLNLLLVGKVYPFGVDPSTCTEGNGMNETYLLL